MPTVSLGEATGQPLNTSVGDATAEPWVQASSTPKVTINAAAAYGQDDTGAGSVTIRELTGPDLRTVVLRERALPYKPLVFGGKHRIEETSYPGFPQKSQQALGAEENDAEWKGQWKTRFIGDTTGGRGAAMFQVQSANTSTIDGTEAIGVDSSQITDAANACEIFDDIRRKGQVCRVSWLHLVRIGRLEEFVQSWTTAHDVDWTMKWKWIGRDEDVGRPSPSEASLLAISHDLSKAYVDLHDSTDLDGIDELEPNIADQIDYKVGRIMRGVLELEDAIEQRAYNLSAPALALRRALQLATFVRDEAQALCDYLDQTVAPSLWLVTDTLRPTGSVVASTPPAQRDLRGVSPGQAVSAGVSLRRAAGAARAMKHKAARQRFAAIRQLESNAIAVVVLAQGDDLQSLSRRYYGTPEDAELIRAFNGLDTFSPPTGTVVVVPQRSQGR